MIASAPDCAPLWLRWKRCLVEPALVFCRERGYEAVILWTLDTLHPARSPYSAFGFSISETCGCVMGGQELTEECWAMSLNSGSQPDRDAILAAHTKRHGAATP